MKEFGWLDIESRDGAAVRARVFSPVREVDSKPVWLVLPAMGVRAAYYEPLACSLAERGMPAVTVDLRGQGESSESVRTAAFGYREVVDVDLPAAADAVRARFPGRDLFAIAHSLGGQLATLSLARKSMRLDGLVLVASGCTHWRTWPRGSRARARLLVAGVSLASKLLPWYPGRRLGFGGNQTRAFMRDWTESALTGRYRLDPGAPVSGTPVLSVEIEGDVIAPEGAARCLLTRFDPASISRRSVSPSDGASGWKRHFAWVGAPSGVLTPVEAWIDERERAAQSDLSIWRGSTFVASRAGKKDAADVTTRRSAETARSVGGS